MSYFLKLAKNDFVKALIMVIITAILGTLLEMIKNKGLTLTMADFQQILTITIVAGLGYLVKQLGTNSQGEFGKGETGQSPPY